MESQGFGSASSCLRSLLDIPGLHQEGHQGHERAIPEREEGRDSSRGFACSQRVTVGSLPPLSPLK